MSKSFKDQTSCEHEPENVSGETHQEFHSSTTSALTGSSYSKEP
ncbi:Uncharacterised protein [Mycobacteroides abscessus]|nr:Uncharacterised protein [Mycobacteroides abscessus]SIC18020.1 Uncharacterised protein [Mycobacteroides abscessus subsp. abscessus]CPU21007.1 Uncharacterised protein [Mycobacteroides abscessus]CPU60037.1 Uncharacterised protein [Mycobacteroides abscessus]CPU62142.1 Uncharacterised protein [Mycobacteroides abscessus]